MAVTSTCPICKNSGFIWKKCEKCGRVFCKICALKGLGGIPKTLAGNKCPLCGQYNCLKTA